MLSFAGIPPVAGFFAKYYVFIGAIKNDYTWLVLIAVLSSLIGVYYYFKVIITLFQPADRESVQLEMPSNFSLLLVIIVILTLVLGIAPGFVTYLI